MSLWSAALLAALVVAISAAGAESSQVEVETLVGCLFRADCLAADRNGDEKVNAADLVSLVVHIGGAATPTPTGSGIVRVTPVPTVTRTRTPASHTPAPSATPTPSPSSTRTSTVPLPTPQRQPGEAVAGVVGTVANGLTVVPSLFTAIASAFGLGGGAGDGGAAASCALGGTSTFTCSGAGRITTTIRLTACRVATAGGSVTFGGTVVLRGTGSCSGSSFPPLPIIGITQETNLTATTRDGNGDVVSVATATLESSVATPTIGGSCFLTQLPLQRAAGTIETTYPAGPITSIGLTNTDVTLAVESFNSSCAPTRYTLSLDGDASLSIDADGGEPGAPVDAAIELVGVEIVQDARAEPILVDIAGTFISPCLGGSAALATDEDLAIRRGLLCPDAGLLRIATGSGELAVRYDDAGVGVDVDLDGEPDRTIPGCLHPEIIQCDP